MNYTSPRDEYLQALHIGQKEYRARVARGESPYLAVLDDILVNTDIVTQESLGLVSIPLESIAGTKTSGRHTAFAPNYMPLLGLNTEFADKWCNLCGAHLREGIRVPIKAYEFMNRFYVQEGNKRVSVLKYYQAVTVPGTVTRLIPRLTDSPETRIYYEFLEFYKHAQINYIWFTREGSFARLQSAVCKASGENWTKEDRLNFFSLYTNFRVQFQALGGPALGLTPGDALLVYLSVYRYADACEASPAQLLENLTKIWDEVKVLAQPKAVEVLLHPQNQPASQPLLKKLIPGLSGRPEELNIVFLHEKSTATSAWTTAHSKGRQALEKAFPDRVHTSYLDNVVPGVDDETRLEAAVLNGADVIFTTSSQMMPACLKVAARHPEVKMLNCSLNVPHPLVRTYYCRMYEAKYLLGMLAGMLTYGTEVGYVANFPLYGVCAGINAFARGLKAVRPGAKVLLRWLCVPGTPPLDFSDHPDISILSGRDQKDPLHTMQYHGLCRRLADGTLQELGAPIWHWGNVYQQIVRSILDGTWDNEENGTPRAINYWWGMSAGAVEVHYAAGLPADSMQLIRLVEEHIRQGEYDPFAGELHAQGGRVVNPLGAPFSAEDLIHMNWLADNVIGSLPGPDDVSPEFRSLIELQGVQPDPLA
ncbi:MAG: BMP family ABC transporter substrate-binding protein [Faecalibacterium sp.]|jgi:basic membrane lipoprotein Med (substrate-binding protein (PBP1-ABC) superfamily)|nr:BMP family ABC transporter substrate-binding protein [Faecalibacterium sp.]